MKKTLFIITLFSLLCMATQGFALERYKSRKSPYFQLGVNIGGGNTYNVAKANPQLLAGDRSIDFGVNFGAGFGFSDLLTIGGEAFTLLQPQSISDPVAKKVGNRFIVNAGLMADVDLFLFGGFAIGAGAGLALEYYQSKKSNQDNVSATKVGFAGKGSIGYEGFIGPDYALGGRFYYNYNYYAKGSHDSLGVQVYMRWY